MNAAAVTVEAVKLEMLTEPTVNGPRMVADETLNCAFCGTEELVIQLGQNWPYAAVLKIRKNLNTANLTAFFKFIFSQLR
jgi:hypothetical protein